MDDVGFAKIYLTIYANLYHDPRCTWCQHLQSHGHLVIPGSDVKVKGSTDKYHKTLIKASSMHNNALPNSMYIGQVCCRRLFSCFGCMVIRSFFSNQQQKFPFNFHAPYHHNNGLQVCIFYWLHTKFYKDKISSWLYKKSCLQKGLSKYHIKSFH